MTESTSPKSTHIPSSWLEVADFEMRGTEQDIQTANGLPEADQETQESPPSSGIVPEPTPPGGLDAFGPPALLADEDPDAYNALLARFTDLLKPGDILEEFLVRDLVDLIWDQLRFRRLKADMLAPEEQALAYKVKHADRLDQMCLRAGIRRDAVLRELERYRNSAELHAAKNDVQDVEFEELPTPALQGGAA